MTNPMHLLEPKRVIEDEGLFRTLKIGFNVATHPKAAKRILAMPCSVSKIQPVNECCCHSSRKSDIASIKILVLFQSSLR
jgi:hypothetical protein